MARRNEISEKYEEKTPEERKRASRRLLLKLGALIGVTVVVLAVYKFFMDRPEFYIVFPVYAVIAAASVIGYVVYNRGFSRKGITREMLPDTMSEDEKTAFIEDARRRSEKSRWLLIIAFAFIFTFAFDAFDLFVIQGIFGK